MHVSLISGVVILIKLAISCVIKYTFHVNIATHALDFHGHAGIYIYLL